jgi:hypothetical protein
LGHFSDVRKMVVLSSANVERFGVAFLEFAVSIEDHDLVALVSRSV